MDGNKQVNISLSLDPNSKEYKGYYFEIEEFLMGNCSSIKKKMAENEIIGEKSYSNNEEAMRYYQLGLDESKKEDFAKAIENYKKALSLGYTASIPDIYAAGEIKFDFSPEYVKELMEFVNREYNSI